LLVIAVSSLTLQVEEAVGQHLSSKSPASTEKATETLGSISGKRKALFIGINCK
jgi:hypothetical protein